ncbi:glycosyltransferase, partial [Vibrio alginolyticus]
MKKALIFDPYAGNIAGAQKVTHNVIDIIANRYKVLVYVRERKSQHVEEHKKKSSCKIIPLEKNLSELFGKGTSDSDSKNGLTYKINALFTILFLNVFFLIEVLKNKPEIVYTYDPRGLILCGLFLKLTNVKLVWHLHGPINYSRLLKKLTVSIPDEIIVPSNYIKRSIQDVKKDAVVVYNGFDFEEVHKS